MKAMESVGLEIEAQVKERRNKRAKALAAAGLVNRDRDRFLVSSKGLVRRTSPYVVRRDETGRIRCSCLEFEETIESNSDFRCEHILAVKFAIATKNTEPVTKPKRTTGIENRNATESSLAVRQKQRKAAEATAPIPSFLTPQRMSGDGEQISGGDSADETIGGHAVSVEADLPLTANIEGVNKVNEKSLVNSTGLPETATTTAGELQPTNVLAFAPSPRNGYGSGEDLRRDDSALKTGSAEQLSAPPSAAWEFCLAALDGLSAAWTQNIPEIRLVGDFCVVTVAINVDGFHREGIGIGSARSADGIRAAERQAFVAAALKFEAVRHAEIKSDRGEKISKVGNRVFPSNPMAQTLSDLVTARQLGMIRAVAREIGIDASEECYRLVTCRPNELSRDAASVFIDHLAELRAAGTVFDASARRAN